MLWNAIRVLRRYLPISLLLYFIMLQASAEQPQHKATGLDVYPSLSIGCSYPQIVSISTGLYLPLSTPLESPSDIFPKTTSLNASLDIGLGGGMISGGLTLPDSSAAYNVKAALLRTWLVNVGQELNRNYTGGIVEALIPSHPGAKLGIGIFADREQSLTPRDHFVYVYLGVGF